MYEIAFGRAPGAWLVCHTCDNPACVRPCHLFLGTHADNQQDAKRKGRKASGIKNGMNTQPESRPRGQSHGNAKLTADKVRAVRRLSRKGWLQREIAQKFDIAQTCVSKVLAGKLWRHVK